ncbi:hypothetical protein [Rhabdochlamydiaceae symbiont of Dictyostelium giganteum]|uniref:hypothetical protein n=1 Tax=Rhabdochlamydiaceae symbiont of Dictyostelium giganteum TaxID=3342349 RepID=UPI00384F30D9
MFSSLYALLAIYWFIKLTLFQSTLRQKVYFAFMAALSLWIFFKLPQEMNRVFIGGAGILLLFFLFLESRKKPLRFAGLIGYVAAFIYVTGFILAALYHTFSLFEHNVIGYMHLKGKETSTLCSWKNPYDQHVEKAYLPAYELEVLDQNKNRLFQGQMIGDLVAIRTRVIILSFPVRFLGFSHLYQLDMIYNGYNTASRHISFPHFAYGFSQNRGWLEKIWSQLFTGEWNFPGIKRAVLESSFFPLKDNDSCPLQQEYELILDGAGVSARLYHPS